MLAELYRQHVENLNERRRIAEMIFPNEDPGDDHEKRDEMEALLYGVAGLKETVLEPLAENIALKLGAENYEVLGPFGLRSVYAIHYNLGGKTDSMNVSPVYDDDGFHLEYDTEKTVQRYRKGSLGDFHGFNVVTEPLPDDLDEIIQKAIRRRKTRRSA